MPDYYATIIRERNASEAASLLADDCRKKDSAIRVLKNTIKELMDGGIDYTAGLICIWCNADEDDNKIDHAENCPAKLALEILEDQYV